MVKTVKSQVVLKIVIKATAYWLYI